jgi:hypothetical protein
VDLWLFLAAGGSVRGAALALEASRRLAFKGEVVSEEWETVVTLRLAVVGEA